jgi:hypothetical protein
MNIYNFDESSLRSDSKSMEQLIATSSKSLFIPEVESVPATTMAFCVAANGEKMESLIIFNTDYAHLTKKCSYESVYPTSSPRGWITKDIFVSFLVNILLPHIQVRLAQFCFFVTFLFFFSFFFHRSLDSYTLGRTGIQKKKEEREVESEPIYFGVSESQEEVEDTPPLLPSLPREVEQSPSSPHSLTDLRGFIPFSYLVFLLFCLISYFSTHS